MDSPQRRDSHPTDGLAADKDRRPGHYKVRTRPEWALLASGRRDEVVIGDRSELRVTSEPGGEPAGGCTWPARPRPRMTRLCSRIRCRCSTPRSTSPTTMPGGGWPC